MLSVLPWVQWVGAVRCPDDPAGLRQSTADMLRHVDALLLTGGVSMGTHDFVPGVLDESGCRVVFHRLPIRPGGPMLGAVGPQGQAVLGLPGNPLSVMTTLRRIGLPALRRLSGQRACDPPAPAVALTRPDGRSLKLWWYRPVVLETDGGATLVDSRGSGDVASAARSDGFVEIPPDQTGSGPWAYYRWSDG
jgi:molybdopterin biosynthesis enzyme